MNQLILMEKQDRLLQPTTELAAFKQGQAVSVHRDRDTQSDGPGVLWMV